MSDDNPPQNQRDEQPAAHETPAEHADQAKIAAAAAAVRTDVPTPSEERRTRAMIMLGVGLTLFGIALSVSEDSFGRWFVILGVVLAFVALHRFGHLGPLGV